MIPVDFIAEWRERAPWLHSSQVEQDLVISRALVMLYQNPEVANALAFRGGTALYKLHLAPAARYSEDIDLVQIAAGPIGPLISALREALGPWLGEPKRAFKEGRATLIYRFQSEDSPPLPLRLKLEINTREHFSVLGLEQRPFEVRSRWFSGVATIHTFPLEELLGTKLRALYQRKKGRDLFDLWWANQRAQPDAERIVECFERYLAHAGHRVSRAEFEANLAGKLADAAFLADLDPLLAADTAWDAREAGQVVRANLLARLPGEPWRGDPGSLL